MAKIVSMSSGAIDPIAQSKRVFYRPVAADTVRVGDLVCYNWDSVQDHKERAADPTHLGLTIDTYAEGAQDFTARLFIVEKPTEENLQFFAGVVKALGPKAGADDDMIEIWVPNGAVLPVMIDQDTIHGRTIVCVRDGVYEGSFASNDARPIGVAMETVTGSGGDALCWVKVDPNMFLWQASNADSLLLDDGTDAWTQVNKIQLEYAGAQWVEVLTSCFELLAACTGKGTAIQAETEVGKVTSGDYSSGLVANINFGAGFGGTGTAAGGGNAASLKLNVTAGAVLTSQYLSVLKLNHMLPAAGITGPTMSCMIQCNCTEGANAPDYFLYGQNNQSIGYVTGPQVSASKIGQIKIASATMTGFIWVYDGLT